MDERPKETVGRAQDVDLEYTFEGEGAKVVGEEGRMPHVPLIRDERRMSALEEGLSLALVDLSRIVSSLESIASSMKVQSGEMMVERAEEIAKANREK
jgi:hypothetical protein